MAPADVDMSSYFKPALCANHLTSTTQCINDAKQACSGCQLVQYCSKECQKTHWPEHKSTCKSAFIKDTWVPEWQRQGRKPAFIEDGPPLAKFGAVKYLWGNMPALDILNLKDNEGIVEHNRDLALLFAASGDPRNIIKTIASLPADYSGKCHVVVNDMDFAIVARNAILLLIALYYDAEVAVPMMIHIWYSALLPSAMVHALQSDLLPLIQDVCEKIVARPDDMLQAKTLNIRGHSLRLVLKKIEWVHLVAHFHVPKGLTAEKAQALRRDTVLAPSRIDYRERAMLAWPPALRQAEMNFRQTGILLPYGCSVAAFDTPNTTIFNSHCWPMMDSSNPRAGWLEADVHACRLIAKADDFGALFMFLRDLLLQFFERLNKSKISFELFCVNAKNIGDLIVGRRFDRIEVANVCDRAYIGPHSSLQAFSPLLKDKSSSPNATILFLFLNAAKEMTYNSAPTEIHAQTYIAMARTKAFLPQCSMKPMATQQGYHSDLILRVSALDLLSDWSDLFDAFLQKEQYGKAVERMGLRIKPKHTIVEPWPYSTGEHTTKEEFDKLMKAGTSGCERYMELERL